MSPAAPRDPGRSRGSCLLKLLALLAVLGAATALGWMLLLPVVVVAQLRERTGFDATVETLSCNVFSGRIAVRGLVVKNPASFPIGDFLDLRAFLRKPTWGRSSPTEWFLTSSPWMSARSHWSGAPTANPTPNYCRHHCSERRLRRCPPPAQRARRTPVLRDLSSSAAYRCVLITS